MLSVRNSDSLSRRDIQYEMGYGKCSAIAGLVSVVLTLKFLTSIFVQNIPKKTCKDYCLIALTIQVMINAVLVPFKAT